MEEVSERMQCRWGVGLFVVMLMVGCGGGGDGTSEIAPSQWTVMVYLDGDNDLEAAALEDFNEMELAQNNPDVKIIVLMDRSEAYSSSDGDWTGTRLYHIHHDTDLHTITSPTLVDTTWLGLQGTDADELNMGLGDTLKRFVTFCTNEYPSQHTALILWDHGSGWAPASVDASKSNTKFIAIDNGSAGDALSIKEISAALVGQPVDVLGFDACLMAEIEVAWELRDGARYMVASEGLEPSSGWDYTALFNRFTGTSTGNRNPATFVQCAVDTYLATGAGVTLSAVDLTALAPLGEAVDSLALEMSARGADAVTIARYQASNYNENSCVDLKHFAQLLAGGTGLVDAMDGALSKAVVYTGASPRLGACGLSIYFPIFGFSSQQYGDYNAANLSFVDDSGWAGALARYKTTAHYLTLETRTGALGPKTQMDFYTEALAWVGSHVGWADGGSKLRVPVSMETSYSLRVSSPEALFFWGTEGGYGVYAGWNTEWPSAPSVGVEGDRLDGNPDRAQRLTVGSAQAHYLGIGDDDWFCFDVPGP